MTKISNSYFDDHFCGLSSTAKTSNTHISSVTNTNAETEKPQDDKTTRIGDDNASPVSNGSGVAKDKTSGECLDDLLRESHPGTTDDEYKKGKKDKQMKHGRAHTKSNKKRSDDTGSDEIKKKVTKYKDKERSFHLTESEKILVKAVEGNFERSDDTSCISKVITNPMIIK